MLTPILAAPPRKRLASTCYGPKYDCGRFGKRTAREIAQMVGISTEAVRERYKRGWRGEKLCLSRYETRRQARGGRTPARHQLVAALKMARQFGDRTPTLAEIQAIRPMSREHANAWRRAYITAREDAAQHGSDEG